jgi:hypothetical protein
MTDLKNCNQIRTSRNIKSFRSCLHSTAVPLARLDKGRICLGEEKRLWSNQRALWLQGGMNVASSSGGASRER